ncbi:asparagine synthase-related protein [Sphingomonas sp. MMS24-J45]|uniref:asparagine synthase-related protein n=1 Tax=Sphingomonas sp. MMS24-J45 TaxID=3238806 RepID=UPI00384A94B5
MIAPGLYALGSFAGEPIEPADCQILGLDPANESFAGTARDFPGTHWTIDRFEDAANVLIFLGVLHDAAKLAVELGRAEAGPAELALAALLRWGVDGRAKMPGEWSLLHWDKRDKRLHVATSYRLRDRVLIAQAGSRFAVAPNLTALSRLSWIDDAIDPTGLAFELSPQRFRLGHEGYTVLRQVRQVEAGQCITLDAAGKHIARRAPLQAIPWQGSFEEGVAAATDALRGIIRRAMAPYHRIGVTLSGGLDSALVAAIAVEELRSDQTLTAFTSVAPPGTGLIDERAWTQQTANHLGIELVPVWPSDTCAIYRPARHHLENGPTKSVRHYLYDAIYGAAQERGVQMMLDGEYGESALSRSPYFDTPLNRARRAVRGFRDSLRPGSAEPARRFMVQFAPEFVASLPAPLRAPVPPMPTDWVSRSRPMRFSRGQAGFGVFPTADTGVSIRRATPCLGDVELLRLVAGMPASFLRRDGYNRALIRGMLNGKVPEETRLRTEKRAFSPDYDQRLTREAPSLTSSIDAWRAANVQDFLDARWIARNVDAMAAGNLRPAHIRGAFHMTAMAAEFLLWWSRQR